MAVLGRIPFDPVFTQSMVQGKTIFEYDEHADVWRAVKDIWNKIITSSVMNN